MITITFNSDKLQAGDVPGDWRGLTDPKWAGKTSVSHPGFSGLAGTWAVVMFKLYGEKFFTDLRDARPQVGRSIQDTVTMLASGERILAAGNVSSTLESRARGNPLAVTYPTDGVVLVASNSAIIRGTKHPNAARLLMEFLSSPEANAIFVQEFGETMHDNVAPNPANKSPNEVANNYLSVAEITDGIPKVTELWRNVFGV
jgi:iron(III) transport system substrate-binding protein